MERQEPEDGLIPVIARYRTEGRGMRLILLGAHGHPEEFVASYDSEFELLKDYYDFAARNGCKILVDEVRSSLY